MSTTARTGRLGYRLTAEYQEYQHDWESNYGGCSCHMGHPPCSSCTHPGHYLSLLETDEAWVRDYFLLVPTEDML